MSCGTGPDATAEEGEVLMPRRRKIVDKSICGRCRDAKALYAVRNTTFCRACFLESVTQRFIRGLYSSIHIAASPADAPRTRKFPAGRPHPRAGQVVVALSGGAGSMAMLDNLHAAEHIGQGDGKRADKTKGERDPIWDSGTAVYVEFAGVTGMADRREEMERMVKRKGLDFVAVRAEEVFDDALPMRFGGERQVGGLAVDLAHADLQFTQPSSSTPTSHLDKLKALLSSLPAASRPAVLSNILSAILNLAARTLPNVSHILIGETSTREAQRVISGAAGGRGWSIPLELQPALPAGDREVFRLKPMKELAVKEVAIYCHLKGVKTINERKWAGDREAGKGKGKAPSLEMLTEHFIAGLSVTHPSTVSTIIKTGDKLVFPGEVMGETCPMCQLPVDASAKAWKQRTALTRLEKTPTTDPAADGQAVSSAGLADMLCYACLTTFTPTTHTRSAAVDPVELPHWVGSRVLKSKRVEQAEMRQEIESFLL